MIKESLMLEEIEDVFIMDVFITDDFIRDVLEPLLLIVRATESVSRISNLFFIFISWVLYNLCYFSLLLRGFSGTYVLLIVVTSYKLEIP